MNTYQLAVSLNIVAPGVIHVPVGSYAELAQVWPGPDPIPTEQALQDAWADYSVDSGNQAITERATELIEQQTGETKAQLNSLMGFTLKLYAHTKGDPTAMEDLDSMFASMVPPVLAIQAHQANLATALTSQNFESLDIEAGTIAGVVGGWPNA